MSSLLLMRRQVAHRPPGPAPLARRAENHPRRRAAAAPPPRALPEWLARVFDFESWAPRSSRMWRLDQYSYERSTSSSDEEVERERAIEGLQARVDALRRGEQRQQQQKKKNKRGESARPGGGEGDGASDDDDVMHPSASRAIDGGAGLSDAPLTAAAIARAAAAAGASAASAAPRKAGAGKKEDDEDDEDDDDDEDDEDAAVDDEPPLTSEEIRLLLLKKWGKQYDMAFVRRDLPGAVFCALNVYCNSLEQRSFILTEEQYVEKLSAIAQRLHVLGQTRRVRLFLQAPAKSSKGLPRRPTMGTAVSISLEVTPAQIEAYFTGPI